MPCAEPDAATRAALLALARQALVHGLEHGRPLEPDLGECDQALRAPGACFVTLKQQGRLRGCIGSLEARQPLARDVAHNAHHAAYADPRFAPLAAGELSVTHIHISLLTPHEPLPATDEAALLAALEPGLDGLVLELGARRATFLPAVWEQLPEPGEFLRQLKHKAGLPGDYWSAGLRFQRYRSHGFGEADS